MYGSDEEEDEEIVAASAYHESDGGGDDDDDDSVQIIGASAHRDESDGETSARATSAFQAYRHAQRVAEEAERDARFDSDGDGDDAGDDYDEEDEDRDGEAEDEDRRRASYYSSEAEFDVDEREYESVEALKRSALGRRYRGPRDDEEDEEEEEEHEEAAASRALAVVREELTCPVCVEVFRDPIALRCGHALCRSCCRSLLVGSYPRRAVCPICRRKFRAREDEEAPTCVALGNAARAVMTREERDDASRAERDEAGRGAVDDGGVGRALVAASAAPPPLGWARVPGFGRRVVVATRNVRREGRDAELDGGMRVCLGARLSADALDAALEAPTPLELSVAVLRMEDDEDADGGFPWVLRTEEDDVLVADDHGARDVSLAVGFREPAAAALERGECAFPGVDVRPGDGDDDPEWVVLEICDEDAGLELRIGVKRTLDDFDEDDDESDASDDDEDRYDEDDGFIVMDEEDHGDVSGDDEDQGDVSGDDDDQGDVSGDDDDQGEFSDDAPGVDDFDDDQDDGDDGAPSAKRAKQA